MSRPMAPRHRMYRWLDDVDHKVQLGVVSDFDVQQQQRACSSRERQEKRNCLIDALEHIVDDCPREGTGRREWLGAALDDLLQKLPPGTPDSLDSAPSLSPSAPQQPNQNTLDIRLSSTYPLEVVSIGRVSEGPRIGHHALYVKTQYQFTRFLELPRELRNRIYRFATTSDEPIVLIDAVSRDDPTSTLTPALLTVSKQVHEEAMDVLYGENTFLFLNVQLPELWQGLSEKSLRRLRRLEIPLSIDDDDSLLALSEHLWRLPQLTHLLFTFDHATYEDFCQYVGVAHFALVLSGWLDGVARLRGNAFAGLNVLSARYYIPGSEHCGDVDDRFRQAIREYLERERMALMD
ncbi:hypothetical protein HDK64DRAFT_8951 [Phyllosticta capitalensis]